MTRYMFIHNVWYMFKNTRVIQISVFFLNIENIIKINKIAMDGGWWMVDDGWCKIIKYRYKVELS